MPITETEAGWLHQYQVELSYRFPGLAPRVVLFGSKARGTDRADSDVDVLVIIRDGDWKARRAVAEVGYELSQRFNVDASIIVRSEQEWARLEDTRAPFWCTVSRDGVVIR